MTKGLWKSSKKKQRLYENFWRMGTMKRNWIIYNTKHFSSLWKRNQEKNYYSDLTDSYKYNIKKMLNVMKEIIGWKRVINVLLPNFMMIKNIEIFDKKEIAGTITNYFVNVDTNLAASILESRTISQDYIHYNVPCHSTINITVLELENAFASFKTNKSSGYDNISSNVVKKKYRMKYLLFWNIFSISL